MSDVEPEGHTYVTHLQFSARDDEHARQIAAKFHEVIEQWHEFIERDLPEDEQITMQPQGYVIEATHLTDADDWAEHLPNEDICYECGEIGGTDRLRVGNGNRWCRKCVNAKKRVLYAIEDVRI